MRLRTNNTTEQLLKFCLVGLSNGVLDIGAYVLLLAAHPTTFGPTRVLYNSIAIGAALCNSWVWNSRWTFRDDSGDRRHGARRMRLLFAMQGLLGMAANDICLLFGTMVCVSLGLGSDMVASLAVKLVSIAAASCIGFVSMKFVVFVRDRAAHPILVHQEARLDAAA